MKNLQVKVINLYVYGDGKDIVFENRIFDGLPLCPTCKSGTSLIDKNIVGCDKCDTEFERYVIERVNK